MIITMFIRGKHFRSHSHVNTLVAMVSGLVVCVWLEVAGGEGGGGGRGASGGGGEGRGGVRRRRETNRFSVNNGENLTQNMRLP